MENEKLELADYTALAEFRYQLRLFLEFSENEAKRVGLSPRQHQAILVIKGYGNGQPITIGDLANRLRIRHHSAVELANRLCENDLVTRSQDDEDQRRILLRLTKQAEAYLAELSVAHLSELSRIEPTLRKVLSTRRQASGT